MQVLEFEYETVILFLRVLRKKPKLSLCLLLLLLFRGYIIRFSNGFALFPRGIGGIDNKSKHKSFLGRCLTKFL